MVVRSIIFNCSSLMDKQNPYNPSMRKLQNRPRESNADMHNTSSYPLNSSFANQNLKTESEESLMFKKSMAEVKKEYLDDMLKVGYQPARYHRAVQYRDSHFYKKKMPGGQYQELELYCDTRQLRLFGLGPYFYIEFMRRIMWLFFVLSLLHIIVIIINFKGKGLDNYSESFSTYLIQSTVGNYSGNSLTSFDVYWEVFVPWIGYIAIFTFYIIWKLHYLRIVSKQDEANADVKPEKFCVEFNGLDEEYVNEEELSRFMEVYGPIYQVSLVRRHKDKLKYFEQLDELQEQIREQELELKLGNGTLEEVEKLMKQKEKLKEEVDQMRIVPETTSAYVHFQFEQTKTKCLKFNQDHYLYDTCGHCCLRNCCCCCIQDLSEDYKFRGKTLYIKNERVPTPEDINWQSPQLTGCNKACRGMFVCLVIVLFLLLSCTIIGICTIYISSHSSNCDGVETDQYTATTVRATNNETIIRCYCNAHLVESFTDSEVKQTCKDYLKDIYVQQAVQYVVIITAGITNLLFGLIVDKLVNCVRPISFSSILLTKTSIYTSFLILNTITIPILVYASIFGFEASNYVSLLTIISTDFKNLLSVQNISLYAEYEPIWYRNVSPLFTNVLIIDSLVISILFCVNKCRADKSSLEDDEGKILQKHMNQQITSFSLDVYKQAAHFYMFLTMTCIFFVGIPILLPLFWVNSFLRYTFNRSLLQKNSTKIEGLGEEFMGITLVLLPLLVIFTPLNGQWMLVNNSSIYPDGWEHSFNFLYGAFSLLDKQLYIPFYLCLSLVAAAEFIIYNTVGRFCSCLYEKCVGDLGEKTHHPKAFREYTKSMNVLASFNIRNNDKMKNVILNLEKYFVDKEIQ